ncbi:MAG: hypothetical protein PVJ67_01670 [Candidatus Pacearchaeota archaeon]|jgi:hypothetical protein
MSLKIKLYKTGKNPFPKDDLLKRNVLLEFMNNGRGPEEIKENDLLQRAFIQFRQFYSLQQICIYGGHLPVEEMRRYTKYLKNNVNRS